MRNSLWNCKKLESRAHWRLQATSATFFPQSCFPTRAISHLKEVANASAKLICIMVGSVCSTLCFLLCAVVTRRNDMSLLAARLPSERVSKD